MLEMGTLPYLASLRNLNSEFVARNPGGISPEAFLQTWSFEEMARYNWDRYHSLTNTETQHKLQQAFYEACLLSLASTIEPL